MEHTDLTAAGVYLTAKTAAATSTSRPLIVLSSVLHTQTRGDFPRPTAGPVVPDTRTQCGVLVWMNPDEETISALTPERLTQVLPRLLAGHYGPPAEHVTGFAASTLAALARDLGVERPAEKIQLLPRARIAMRSPRHMPRRAAAAPDPCERKHAALQRLAAFTGPADHDEATIEVALPLAALEHLLALADRAPATVTS